MIFIIIVAAIFGLDYSVKSYIEKNKKEGQSEKILKGAITVQRLSNQGAAGGIMEKNPKAVKYASGLALGIALIEFLKCLLEKGNYGLKLCYSLLIGGGLSNFYDRLKKGAVTDYFSFNVPLKKIKNLVFNISDMFVIVGSLLALILSMKKKNNQ